MGKTDTVEICDGVNFAAGRDRGELHTGTRAYLLAKRACVLEGTSFAASPDDIDEQGRYTPAEVRNSPEERLRQKLRRDLAAQRRKVFEDD